MTFFKKIQNLIALFNIIQKFILLLSQNKIIKKKKT